MESDPLDWKIPVKTYEFLMRNKRNAGVSNPAIFLEKAIELNLKERTLYEMLIREYQRSGKLEEASRVYFEMQKIFSL
jgi:pentatricopeptide repeat protein